MQRLKYLGELVVNAPNGLFVRATPTTETMKQVTELFGPFCKGRLRDDLHCTVMYAKNPAVMDLNAIGGLKALKNERFHAAGRETEWWAGHDNDGYVVLHLDSPQLVALHTKFRDQGAIPTFTEYKPHMTLVTPAPGDEFRDTVELMNIQLRAMPLEMDFYYAGYVLHTESGGLVETFGDKEYYIRKMREGRYEVAVFEGTERPLDVYEVTLKGKQVECSCPGFKHTPGEMHKHIQLVRKFVRLKERPAAFWFNPLDAIEYRFLP